MPRTSNPFRGGNVCHRISLPRLRRDLALPPPAAPGWGAGPPGRIPVQAPLARVPVQIPVQAPPSPDPHLLRRVEEAEALRRRLEQDLARETSAAAAQEAAHGRELALVQRRLVKLRAALEAREEEFARLALSNGGEPGEASAFRKVQGLDENEPDAQRKRELLGQIFQANVRLQGELALRPQKA